MMIDSDARKVHSMKNPSNIRSLHYHKIVVKQENSRRTMSMWMHDKNVLYINSACTLHTLTKRTMKMLQMENNQFHKKFRCRPKLIWPLVATFNYFRIRGINLNSLRVKHICIVWSGGWWLMLQAIFLFNWLVRVFRFINI